MHGNCAAAGPPRAPGRDDLWSAGLWVGSAVCRKLSEVYQIVQGRAATCHVSLKYILLTINSLSALSARMANRLDTVA